MYLFKNHKDGLTVEALTSLGGVAPPTAQQTRSLFKGLTGEENPRVMGGLLLTLVLSAHLCAAVWMLQPAEPVTQAQPMIMEVSLIAAPSPQPAAVPVAQPKPEEPKKTPVKKPAKKKEPVVRKQMELPKPLPMSDAALPAPSAAPPMAASAPSTAASKPAAAAPFTEANFNANYGSNPKPKYPRIATSRGWEGTVRLLVKVSAEGDSEEVTVQHSSGHDVLDEAAIEAVEKWKLIPAKRGDTPVSSSVIVPINFVLNN